VAQLKSAYLRFSQSKVQRKTFNGQIPHKKYTRDRQGCQSVIPVTSSCFESLIKPCFLGYMKNWAETSQKSFKKALTAENFGDILISR
jgi:hypothetical protein